LKYIVSCCQAQASQPLAEALQIEACLIIYVTKLFFSLTMQSPPLGDLGGCLSKSYLICTAKFTN
jgi:hypothetical protein